MGRPGRILTAVAGVAAAVAGIDRLYRRFVREIQRGRGLPGGEQATLTQSSLLSAIPGSGTSAQSSHSLVHAQGTWTMDR